MKRRQFFETLGVGSAFVVLPGQLSSQAGQKAEEHSRKHDHRPMEGADVTATISFGQWQSDPPLDRFPNSSPIAPNSHMLLPSRVTIRAGGAVNFIISGLHHILVYGPGTKPEDINVGLTTPTTGTPAGVPLINDPANRVYRGLDPSAQASPFERTEVVRFPNPGRFLVICGVFPHFVNDRMFGFVNVRR